MKKVIFLDRDGTINQEVNYLYRPADLKLFPDVPKAIGFWNRAGFKVVVVTNQAGVARGYYQEAQVDRLHAFLNEQLSRQGARIDAFYYCPHHPEHGIGSYKTRCGCRKPEIGMFLAEQDKGAVDKAHSYMIGDKWIDVEAGYRFGVHTALVGTGYGKELYDREENPAMLKETRHLEFYGSTLWDIAKWIAGREGIAGSD